MTQNRKNHILITATDLFAKKGYDATGMDEIAKAVGVPKSLLYYHFKNKEELLNSIIDCFIEKYKMLFNDNEKRGISKITDYINLLKTNKSSVKIILAESLKEKKSDLLFKSLNVISQRLNQEDAPHFTDKKSYDEHLIAEFFTSIIPTLFFVCVQDDWCDYFNTTLMEAEKAFTKIYEQTHGAYHDSINRESY